VKRPSRLRLKRRAIQLSFCVGAIEALTGSECQYRGDSGGSLRARQGARSRDDFGVTSYLPRRLDASAACFSSLLT